MIGTYAEVNIKILLPCWDPHHCSPIEFRRKIYPYFHNPEQ